MEKFKKYFFRKINRYITKIINDAYAKSTAQLIFKSTLGVQTIVHPEKLADILETNQSCDAEPWMKALEDVLPKLEVVIDVGANIGIVSCWLAKKSRKIYAFEPNEANRDYLQKNIQLNMVENLEVYPLIVGESDGLANFYCRKSFGHHGTTLRHVSKLVKTIKIPSIALDNFCVEQQIEFVSLLKIDTEGSEINVLRGFDNYIKHRKVTMIIFEHAPILFQSKDQAVEVYDFLSQRGYQIFDLKNNIVHRMDMLNSSQGDFYAKPA